MFDTTHAACRDKPTQMFFRERKRGSLHNAKLVCKNCPIKEECGDWAVKNHVYHGVWGGMTPRELETQRRLREIVLPVQYGTTRGKRYDA